MVEPRGLANGLVAQGEEKRWSRLLALGVVDKPAEMRKNLWRGTKNCMVHVRFAMPPSINGEITTEAADYERLELGRDPGWILTWKSLRA